MITWPKGAKLSTSIEMEWRGNSRLIDGFLSEE
jgi:hypothetical protein